MKLSGKWGREIQPMRAWLCHHNNASATTIRFLGLSFLFVASHHIHSHQLHRSRLPQHGTPSMHCCLHLALSNLSSSPQPFCELGPEGKGENLTSRAFESSGDRCGMLFSRSKGWRCCSELTDRGYLPSPCCHNASAVACCPSAHRHKPR